MSGTSTMSTMREQSYLVLLALAGEPLHGYAVLKQVETLSDGAVRLGPGTLYGALDRLAGDGLVAVAAEEVVDGRHRRYYRLTGTGREALVSESERRARLSRRAARTLSLPWDGVPA